MNNLKGILLVIASMAGFTLEDAFIKELSTTISTGQILVIVGISGAVIFALMASYKGHRIFAKRFWTRITLARSATEAFAAIAFVTSLALVPLSTVAAVFQATPLAITMGAALFLGEDVGWRRWAAIIIGFIGVLIIIRPGLGAFNPNVLFVLIAVICVAARDLITRLVPSDIPSTVVSSQGFAPVALAGAILLWVQSKPMTPVNTLETYYFIGAVAFGVAGYYAIVAAMRVGDASAVTPFRYTRLLFSLLVGVVIFKERPDLLTLLGAAIIITTGLYTFLRERRLAKKSSG
ncbi:DMT family transporter [Amylibacter sp. SFDW26]|uniref:DMT family transporter n=1 Tax=Amylibacter sp. SFDW26 TaxID=2652722 RepID=UPI0012613EF5|nr:DMT family transporter [Amylibacter sp. SFDW26]KAB7613936.1 DMT family transporter [Amylibacter sp. SFDW26]